MLRAIAAFLVIAAFGYPLRRLTEGNPVSRPPEAPETIASSGILVRLTCTAPPTRMTVQHLGEILWNEDAPTAAMERTLDLPYPAEGIDLQVQVTWDSATLGALRVQVTDSHGEEHERTLWGKGGVEDVLTFP